MPVGASQRYARARVAAQRAVAAACRAVPTGPALRLRSAYLDGGPPAVQRARRAALEVLRLGGIPRTGPFLVPGYPGTRMVPTDSYIANHLFWLGAAGYEQGGPDWWARLAGAHNSAVEVGANVGLYTVVAATRAPGVRYRAFEPNPPSSTALRRNLAVNGIKHVRVEQAAVVGPGAAGPVRLRVPARDRYTVAAGAFVEGAVGLAEAGPAWVDVPAVAAEEALRGADLAKLDIEGLELEVLTAVRDWVVGTRPTLLIEVLDAAGELQRLLAGLVAEARYRCVVVDGRRGATLGRPVEVTPEEATGGHVQRRFRTRDVTLITAERLTALGPGGVRRRGTAGHEAPGG